MQWSTKAIASLLRCVAISA